MRTSRRGWRQAWRDAALLPVVLIVVLLEDVLWRGARAVLKRLAHALPVRGLRQWLGRLPAAAAVPLFLVPEATGRIGGLWSAWLLYRGHVVSAALVYGLVRVASALIAVFIWQCCEPALMQLPWFARFAGWVRAVRDWGLVRIAPVRRRIRRWFGRAGVRRRMAALRRRLLARVRTQRRTQGN